MGDRHVCAVCGRVLDHIEGRGYVHSLAATDPAELDHPAVPVTDDQVPVRERCDFCYGDVAPWVVPCPSFVYVVSNTGDDWLACDTCAGLITRNDWKGLLRRVAQSWEDRHGEPMLDPVQGGLKGMYRELRKRMTGPPYRRAE